MLNGFFVRLLGCVCQQRLFPSLIAVLDLIANEMADFFAPAFENPLIRAFVSSPLFTEHPIVSKIFANGPDHIFKRLFAKMFQILNENQTHRNSTAGTVHVKPLSDTDEAKIFDSVNHIDTAVASLLEVNESEIVVDEYQINITGSYWIKEPELSSDFKVPIGLCSTVFHLQHYF
jgi:hypothetical protein